MRPIAVLAIALAAALPMLMPAAARADEVAPILTGADALDTATFARPQVARVTHVALDLALDFDAKRVSGTATLDIQAAPGAREIVLDSKGYEVESITDPEGHALPFAFGEGDARRGKPLTVQIAPSTGSGQAARRIVIHYHTGGDAVSLQWLRPDQTAGGRYPYLFSQGEAILNRSWIPTQDSPGIRQTWEARITAPEPLKVVMSGERLTPDGEPAGPGRRAFRFRMTHPVAPYLIAIAAGNLAFREIGPRTGVWSEPETVDADARELDAAERMVDAAERLYGPYRWGRYDMIVLPPSFPYGGMENPTLTFLTPTFIAGDKSLVSLIAHELAHSWSGNLATNATWDDFWLNEGMTTYAERRIVESLYGKKVADEQVALGVDALNKAITENGGPTGADTRLHIDLKGRHPDDGLTDIAYEKGAAFLRTIESIVGRERFDAWLKGWFERHSFQPVTSAMFLADIRANLVKGDETLEKKLMLDQWVYQPGIPSNMVRPPAIVFAEQDKAIASFATGGAVPQNWESWTTDERLRFLTRLPRKLDKGRLDALQAAFQLNETGNMEVRFAWLALAVANRYDPAVPSLEQFLGSVGRGKFVRPLYTALASDKAWGLPIAKRIYAANRASYHPQVQDAVDKLKLND
jgi:aminopeptidase N